MAKPSTDQIVREIAEQAQVPIETVSRIYEATWQQYSEGARVLDYMPVLVAKHVRDALRETARRTS